MRRPRLKRVAAFLLLGAFVTVMVCFALAATDELTAGVASSAEAYLADDRWSVTRYDRPAGVRIVSQWSAGRNWSPGQALGPPDTPTGGDQVTAWASSSADGQREWLLLDFARPVVPKSVRVYEMCSTGALDKVEVTRPDGSEFVAWQGVDPCHQRQSMGTSEVPLGAVDFPVARVRLHFDSPSVSGWNEVDAVGLVAQDGTEQYAVAAQASSVYGSGYPASAQPPSTSLSGAAGLVPHWTGIDVSSTTLPTTYTLASGGVANAPRRAHVVAEARGWPMLALTGRQEFQIAAIVVAANPPGSGTLSPYPISSTGSMPGGPYTSLSLSSAYPSGVAAAAAPSKPVMLTRPIPLGFAVNTVLAAVALWLIYVTLTGPRRFIVEVSRLRQGRCVVCGYDLGYDFVGGCPECGWNRWERKLETLNLKSETNPKLENGKLHSAVLTGPTYEEAPR